MIEQVARAIAMAHGDKWDDVPDDKANWVENRGQFGGRFRDVNENFKDCYRDEARAAIEAMREPTEAMIDACDINIPTTGMITGVWAAMIDEALK